MMRIYSFILLFSFSVATLAGGNGEGVSGSEAKDTVQALVINSAIIEKLTERNYSDDQIMTLISKAKKKHHHIKETPNKVSFYYDSFDVPAKSVYQTWTTSSFFNYPAEIIPANETKTLTLIDEQHYCDYAPPIKDPVVTSNFGWRKGRSHNGIDLDLQVWDPVSSAFEGKVRIAKYNKGYGRVVVIRHLNGLETLYAHLHRIKVKVGDNVSAGQVIGLGGSSGRSSGSHLHFEVRYKGKPINPKRIFDFKNNKLVNNEIDVVSTKWGYTAYPKGVHYHVIQKGDYLYKIAKDYNTTINAICDINGIKRNKTLVVGRKIRVK